MLKKAAPPHMLAHQPNRPHPLCTRPPKPPQEEYMERAQAMLKKAGKRLTVVSRQSRSWLMLWVVLFGIALFFVV
jgi:hypothetical protein